MASGGGEILRDAMELHVHEGTLRALMRGCESLLRLLARHELEYWLDWGTLLGCVRHGNIIPWDYDADLCMLADPYQRLRDLFAAHGGQIDGLVLWPNYYGADDQAIMLGFADWPDDSLGIDVVAYDVTDGQVRTRMGAEMIEDYPGQYDSAIDVVLPPARMSMLGRWALVPRSSEARLVECFGADWRTPRAYFVADPPIDPRLSAPPWRALPTEWVRRGPADGPRIVWALDEASEHVGRSFTELVFADGCRLWGRVYVGELAAGEVLELPDGVVAWSPD